MACFSQNINGVEANFETDGFTLVNDVFPIEEIEAFCSIIKDLILEEAQKTDKSTRVRISNLPPERLPHDGLLYLRDANPEHMRVTVDRLKSNPQFYRLIHSERLVEIAQPFVGASEVSHVGFSYPNFRADLPEQFSAEEQKFSLPWHQESSYYKSNASALSSIVFWIPLFDCSTEEGSLELLVGSHLHGEYVHEDYYLDRENKRHFRNQVPDDVVSQFEATTVPVRAGSVLVNHFRTVHRSGSNRSENVRYTLLIRASNIFCKGYCL